MNQKSDQACLTKAKQFCPQYEMGLNLYMDFGMDVSAWPFSRPAELTIKQKIELQCGSFRDIEHL